MKIGEQEAYLSDEDIATTGLSSPIAIFEVDIHSLREAAIADLARMERDFFQSSADVSLVDLYQSLGPEYQSALGRKIIYSKIAAELAMRTVTEKLLDED